MRRLAKPFDALGYLADIRAHIPERLRHTSTPTEIYRRVYGVEPGEHRCDCGRELQAADYPAAWCLGCGKPLPIRCACGGRSDPTPVLVRGEPRGWSEPLHQCVECQRDGRRAAAVEQFTRIVPSGALSDVVSYRAWAHRSQLERTLSEWRKNKLGKVAGPIGIYTYGNPGSGKTVCIVRTLRAVLVDTAAVSGALWVRWYDLASAYERQYSREESVAGAAKALLDRARNCELLVIDEAFRKRLSERAAAELGDLLATRMEWARPLLVTGNSPPEEWGRCFGDWMLSRAQAHLAMVECESAVDMRLEERR